MSPFRPKRSLMLTASLIRKFATILLCVMAVGHKAGLVAFAFDGPPTAGVVITNFAAVTYSDDSGISYSTVSPTVTITVLAVATLTVTPDQTASSAAVGPRERITRLFRVCNTGNMPDAYAITRAEVNTPASVVNLYFDNDASGTLTNADALATVNGPSSPQVLPGACIGVLAVVDTNDSAANSELTIRLTARSNVNGANGAAQDDGTIINTVGVGARLTSPTDNNLPPVKTVNGISQAVVSAGSTFTYAIAFRNVGDVAARGVVVTDDLPTEIQYVAGSLTLDNRSLTDAQDSDEGFAQALHIVIQLPQVVPDQTVNISFKARLRASVPAGVGVLNFAVITGENIAPTKSSTATVVVDPSGTVFAGRGGSAAPIPGALVAILLDQDGNKLIIPPGVGFPPNVQNENPYTTDPAGHFSFALLAEQLGSPSTPARYFVKVTSQGYSTRLLEIIVQPTQAGLFGLTVHALDGQPLARAGGFDLVREDVSIADMAAVALNIPMFEPNGLQIAKSADRPRVEIGDAVGYRLEVHNPTAALVADLVVRDRLPVSFHYAPGTGRLLLGSAIDRPIEPEIAGDEIIFRVGELAAGATARLLYRARIGTNAHEGQQENVAVASGVFPSGELAQTTPARARVMVGSGVFSTQQIIVGRVFVDENRNGRFDDGDKPMPGVRLYLNSGQSVVTDSQGLYNFPSLGDGSQVISLDPISFSQRYALADGGSVSGRSWTRLLRTPLGGGALLHQDFVLIPSSKGQHPEQNSSSANDLNKKVTDSGPVLPTANEIAQTTKRKVTAETSETAIRIAWERRPGASRYRIQLAADPGFKDVCYDGAVVTNEYVASGLAPGRYYWRVATANPEANHFSKPAVIYVQALTTEKYVATESVDPVAPGEVKVLTPAVNEVVMSPAMQLDARVALNWTVKLEVNGKAISDKDIGTTRQDNKNSVTTYTYVGIELRPGPNNVRVTPISPAGAAGRSAELTVLGRGPARRLEIFTDKTEIQADGRDSAIVRVSAYDQWGNPAADDQVALETSAGELLRVDDQTGNKKATNEAFAGINSYLRPDAAVLSEQRSARQTQVIVSLIGGEARLKLVASGAPGEAKLHAQMGQTESEAKVRITPESRPTILVGLAEMTVGQSVPEVNLRGEEGSFRSRLSFFYSGRVGQHTLLTVSYDSQRPINRTAGRDRLFQLDPRDRVYPLFGDSSTRYEAAQSNSKLYARLDHNRSYAMFGDFDADMEDLALTGYARKLTGVKLHAENAQGDFLTVTGARPDTAFARDIFPAGGLGLLQLSHGEILPGSETVVLEVRDRRNPELIISRETLARSVDYNLNSITGELFFLRYISTFDYNLNLVQLVATYEHRASSLSSAVYTARAKKSLKGLGLQLGLAGVVQRQDDTGSFMLAGFDGEKSLPHKGTLRFAFARSQGEIIGIGNSFAAGDNEHDGNAYQLELNQPLPLYEGVVRARYSYASAGFFNPFGATVTPGSQRGEVAVELKPRASSMLHFGLTDERNRTEKVDNSRVTLSAAWDQIVHERIHFHLGYDHRSLNDESSARTTDSNLVTGAVDVKLTDNLQLSVKREQNLGDADPTYPDQTTLAATYKVNQWTKVFLTQRLASAAIMPIGDFSTAGAGFASTGSRHETAVGVETRLGKYSSMTGRYQLENGISGTDSFAVIGLQNRLPITKQFSLELGFERGFHLAGDGESFNSATLGLGWQPTKDFRASARYEFRDRSGQGQLLALGAAGRINESITALSRFQLARTGFEGHSGSSMEGMAALAIRPLNSDRAGLLFSFDHRSLIQNGATGLSSVQTRDRIDSFSTDGYFQATKNLELYARLALRFSANGQADVPFVSTLTYLSQVRAQYRLSRRFDWAGEQRLIVQPSSGTQRSIYGTELGVWALPDLRLGLGYNFNAAGESAGANRIPGRRGFYFTFSSKLSNLFDLFGTSQNGFIGTGKDQPDKTGVQP